MVGKPVNPMDGLRVECVARQLTARFLFFALPKQHPLFLVSLTPLCGGDYTTANYTTATLTLRDLD